MLIQKMPRQPTVSTRNPPTTGPTPSEMPTTPPQTPIARARSRGSVKTFVMIDIATGLSIDPPTACLARAPKSEFTRSSRSSMKSATTTRRGR